MTNKKNNFIETILLEATNKYVFKSSNSIKEYDKLIINAVILFFEQEWNFNADITVKTKQSNKYIGDISLNADSINNNKFTLNYNPNQSYTMIISSLIHELTHIKQVNKGELKASKDWKKIIWKNNYELSVKDYKSVINYGKHKELPWENEAYKNQNDISLREKFFKSPYWLGLKGKDATLDFIIDNM